jgi:hypothetical protein
MGMFSVQLSVGSGATGETRFTFPPPLHTSLFALFPWMCDAADVDNDCRFSILIPAYNEEQFIAVPSDPPTANDSTAAPCGLESKYSFIAIKLSETTTRDCATANGQRFWLFGCINRDRMLEATVSLRTRQETA